MTIKPRGLYIHIPFCVRKCGYCDFCSVPPADGMIDGYIDRLRSEISAYRREDRIAIDTVYVGGGTPSLLTPKDMGEILDSVRRAFDISALTELTVEVNPGTLTREKALAYRQLGVNRISMGLQSIHDNELKSLGRIHSYNDFLDSYRLLRDVGFDNINLDLMYGIPNQTAESFVKTLRTVTSLSPEHISVYGLIIEDGTRFCEMRDSLILPDEDTECEMYYNACDILRASGYSHYEISNYARPGYESRHNLKYWRADEYIGVGAAAYSYFEGMRYGNTRSIDRSEVEYSEALTATDAMYEYAMMRLRLSEGISLSDYRARFGVDFLSFRAGIVDEYVAHGLMKLDGDRLALTERGFYVSNSILVNIL